MATTQTHRYTPLPDTQGFIRLLSLRYGSNQNDVHGTIHTSGIDEAPLFVAVSYVWGNESPTESIVIDSCRLTVSPNLKAGLLSILHVFKPEWLWVDAICINQSDELEKADQIPLMSRIYSEATKVIAWLGPSFKGSDEILRELPDLVKSVNRINGYAYMDKITAYGLPPRDDLLWRGLADLMSLPWFRRLWIRQEAVLARELIFLCGSTTLPFSVIEEGRLFSSSSLLARLAASVASERGDFESSRFSLGQTHRYIELLKASGNGCPLLDLLVTCRFLEVREAVDRIYGSLGLMAESVRQQIPVAYSSAVRQSFWTLYTEVVAILLKESLDVLNEAESLAQPLGLPTFVPNWHSSHPSPERFPLVFGAGIAAGEPAAYRPAPVIGCKLSLKGVVVGEIVDTLSASTPALDGTPNDQGPSGNAAQILGMISEAFARYTAHSPLTSPEAKTTGVARTWRMNTVYNAATESFEPYSQNIHEDCLFTLKYLEFIKSTDESDVEITQESANRHLIPYMTHLRQLGYGRSFIFTKEGGIGMSSRACKPGDLVCIFVGARNPHVLRKAAGKDAYELVGAAYVDGVMNGEVFREPKKYQFQDLTII
jgi:hypothetical protein